MEPSQTRSEVEETIQSASCIGRAAHPSSKKHIVPEATWATELTAEQPPVARRPLRRQPVFPPQPNARRAIKLSLVTLP